MSSNRFAIILAVGTALLWAAAASGQEAGNEPGIDLSGAAIVCRPADSVQAKAVQILQDEIQKRTGIRLGEGESMPMGRTAAILLGTANDFPLAAVSPPAGIAVPQKADGFALWVDTTERPAPTVCLVGYDSRSLLMGAGRLLRLLRMREDKVSLPTDTRLATAPKYAIRGHQLGYRHTANTYDLWGIAEYEQYIRDLILFGTCAVELIDEPANRFRTVEDFAKVRDYRDGPLLEISQWEMDVRLSRLLDAYGLDVWLWEPLSGDVTDPGIREAELAWRAAFYKDMARVDHVMVPGGDPGNTHPTVLMPWLSEMVEVLRNEFPEAGMWVSNQKFEPEENDAFFGYINEVQPDWLTGVAFGPGTKLSLAKVRELTPKQYRIRRYPDITHNVRCQYGVPGWDGRHAQTLGREGINPRPAGAATTHNVLAPLADGFVSYSDGAHDDLNKMVWSSMAWDPDTDLDAILVDYGRMFFGEDLGADVAEGLRMLERNMQGLMLTNDGIDETLAQWKLIGAKGGKSLEDNWRYKMYLFRALFDAYVRARLIVETGFEEEAYAALAKAPEVGVEQAVADARTALAQADSSRVRTDLRVQLERLGVELYDLIGFQLSVREPYRARNPERGALLDKLDRPMNDRPWLEDQFSKIPAAGDVDAQLAFIDRIVNWEDPGPGGFYDDLGNTEKQPHLVRQTTWDEDPGFVLGPQESHYRSLDNSTLKVDPLKFSWLDQAQTLYGAPLIVRYEGLDPDAVYRVRATYFGRYGAVMRLVADDRFEIHGAHPSERPPWPVEFDIPKEATADGVLELAWHLVQGRGCQVAEVWLLKQ